MVDGSRKIGNETKTWTSDLDLCLPIMSKDIPSFKQWINWSGWKGYSNHHEAFDFASYLNEDNIIVVGLPHETPVRAVAAGTVKQVSEGQAERHFPYARFINIEHGSPDSGLFSSYHHVVPSIQERQVIKKGDIIGTLYKEDGNEIGNLVHLHFELTNSWKTYDRRSNPETIFPSISKYRAEPQGSFDFEVEGLPKETQVQITNFKKVLTGIDLIMK